MKDDSTVMTTREAAAFLGTHVETVRRLARTACIPCFKVGKDWRFQKNALARWIQNQRLKSDECYVLVIDDEEKFCEAMVWMLDELGCCSRYATSGALGLELIDDEIPDLVLLDLVMPDMNGARFLEKLRKKHPHLPVAIVTGYPDSDLMHKASRHAPVMILAKPIEKEQLERTLRIAAWPKFSEIMKSEGLHG